VGVLEGDYTQRDRGELRGEQKRGLEAPRKEVGKPQIDVAAAVHRQASTPKHIIVTTPFANQHKRGGESIEHHIVPVFPGMPEAKETESRS
jgi:hypothetical protein